MIVCKCSSTRETESCSAVVGIYVLEQKALLALAQLLGPKNEFKTPLDCDI
jgi:hypothetical protein